MNNDTMNLELSGIVEKNGEKCACVTFSGMQQGRQCLAEGYIPSCKISSYSGFTEEEVRALEDYLRKNLTDLKKRAAKISPLGAMLK